MIILLLKPQKVVNIKGGDKISGQTKDEIRDEKILVKMFNNHYINIVEKSSGFAPKSIGDSSNLIMINLQLKRLFLLIKTILA